MSRIDIDYLRRWVGRERVREDALALFPAQALAATLEREALPEAGDVLPPAWQWLYFNECARRSELGRDGHPRTGAFLPPVPLPRRMWASGEFVREAPLRIGVMAEQRSRVMAVEHKQGSTGDLLFVTLEHQTWQAQQCCLVETQHLVYREMAEGPSPLPAGTKARQQVDFKTAWQPDPVVLFRYSGLTFNGHRIHYDRDYARAEEHYPGLVVQGPLLATLLAEQVARQLPGTWLRTFRFRALRPVLDHDSLHLCGQRDGNDLELWVQNREGLVCMSATATLGAAE